MDSFYLFIPSNSSSHEFPDNKTNNFTVLLPSSLNFSNTWEVALTEISFPHSWYNNDKNYEINLKKSNDSVGSIRITKGFYQSGLDIVNKINHGFSSSRCASRILFDIVSQKITLKIARQEEISFDKTLAGYLGFVSSNRDESSITFNHDNNNPKFKFVEAENILDLHMKNHNIYIYNDILKYSLIGNTFAPILRIIPTFNENRGKNISMNFQDRYYIDVSSNHIKQITFELRNDQGELIEFNRGKVTVVLHFRPKISS